MGVHMYMYLGIEEVIQNMWIFTTLSLKNSIILFKTWIYPHSAYRSIGQDLHAVGQDLIRSV